MSIELLNIETYGPKGCHINSMDIDRYRHNYENFYEKFTY